MIAHRLTVVKGKFGKTSKSHIKKVIVEVPPMWEGQIIVGHFYGLISIFG